MEKIIHNGDLIINSNVNWTDQHHLINGNLYIDKEGILEADHCLIELNSSFSREFNYRFRGGLLKTDHTTIGGVCREDRIYQCNFEIDDGQWISNDTTIRYTYGQTFTNPATVGKITGDGHNAGKWADSIIMTNNAQVDIKNSRYPISLTMSCSDAIEERCVDFNFVSNIPHSAVYNSKNVPGAKYSLTLENVAVPQWFLFMGGISMDGKPMEVNIEACDVLIPSFMGNNLRGEVDLFCRNGQTKNGFIDKSIKIGNLTFKVGKKAVKIFGFGIYCSGNETDLVVKGEKNVCELIFDGGRVELTGDPGTTNFFAQATTYEAGYKEGSGTLIIKNASIADFEWEFLGQITAWGTSSIFIEDCTIGRLKLMTQGEGRIFVKNCTVKNVLNICEDGGEIVLENVTGANDAINWERKVNP